MESEVAAGDWADLPSELIKIVSSNLQNPIDIARLRLVCRWWRISTSPPANKVSLFFPLSLSLSISRSWYYPKPLLLKINASATATAVCLLRPHSESSEAWMVSVQESVAGKLVLRHALTYKEIASTGLDLEDWSSATQIARSYAHIKFCNGCNGIAETNKVEFVSNFSSRSGCRQLVGLCKSDGAPPLRLFGFRVVLSGDTRIAGQLVESKFYSEIQDFVYFKNRIFAVGVEGHIYVFDHTNMKLLKVNYGELWGLLYAPRFTLKRFVVSCGDLYVVLRYYDKCRIYRLVVVDDVNVMMKTPNEWEKVEDLGDRVLFITDNCSFSVSARDLPHPWKPNCIVFAHSSWCVCNCDQEAPEIQVFHLGNGVGGDDQESQFRPMSSLQGYSDLFTRRRPNAAGRESMLSV